MYIYAECGRLPGTNDHSAMGYILYIPLGVYQRNARGCWRSQMFIPYFSPLNTGQPACSVLVSVWPCAREGAKMPGPA
eukprot:scaffold650_cov407-Prasinococcus_capsulatus_cf.AAC.25